MKVTIDQAKKLIDLARQSIQDYFDNKDTEASEEIKDEFSGKSGVFISLYVDEELIGCIGYAEAFFPLYKAVIDGARGAAFEDPRFPAMRKEQLQKLRVELSVLTEPIEIEAEEPEDYLKQFKVGEDGLIIKDDFGGGLLLPQVAVEWDWNEEEFLNQTCKKAGLDPDCWKDMRRHIYKFQAQIFTEEDGQIVKK